MKRRELIAMFSGTSLAWSLDAYGQQRQTPVIGWIGFRVDRAPDGFRQGLRDLGYSEGNNITIAYLWPPEGEVSFARPVAELARRKVDVIAAAGHPAALAVHRAGLTTPVVFVVADPIGSGFVANLAHPGGNMTGLSLAVEEQFSGKWLELLKETTPRLSRAAYLWNPANQSSASSWRAMRTLAPQLGARLQSVELRDPNGLDEALAAIIRNRAEGLILDSDAVTGLVAAKIAGFARTNRLPLISVFKRVVDAGGLMSYGPNLYALWRYAARYVDKILKGANPADLPVEEPNSFELVINLKTARAIGITLPQSLLARADEVIQ